MTDPAAPLSLAERIELIEQAYELMLAYAAQGRQRDDDGASSIRHALRELVILLRILVYHEFS